MRDNQRFCFSLFLRFCVKRMEKLEPSIEPFHAFVKSPSSSRHKSVIERFSLPRLPYTVGNLRADSDELPQRRAIDVIASGGNEVAT